MSSIVSIIKQISPRSCGVSELLAQLNQHHLSLYSPEVCRFTPLDELEADHCVFLGVYVRGTLCGIGAVLFYEEYGEITRMYVDPEYRGQGLAATLLNELLALIRGKSLPFAKLETGEKFVGALKLYEAAGFLRCEAFGKYKEAAVNTYMAKALMISSDGGKRD